MSTGLSLSDPALLAALEHQHRLSVQDYHRMIRAGIFEADARLELLQGVIVEMSPQTPRHAEVIRRLCDPRFATIPADCVIQSQLSLTLGPDSEPEPDVAVVPRSETGQADSHPRSARLVIEVAAESLRKDRLAKSPLYARAGIPEYVIVNLTQSCLEVQRDPDPGAGRYRTSLTLTSGSRFESVAVPGFAFDVAALLA